MNPNDLKLQNGLSCIQVYDEEREIHVVPPEGWKVSVMTGDSGQGLVLETKTLPKLVYPTLAILRTKCYTAPPRMVPNPELMSKRFTCPQCGSHAFGTGPLHPERMDEAEGYCHGRKGEKGEQPCLFRWKRKDDARYFR